jgi:Tol biopolymer transport system component
MRTVWFAGFALLAAGCDFVEGIARASGPEHAYAQAVPMDTAGVVARRVAAALPGELDPAYMSMLPDGRSGVTVDWETGDLVRYELATGVVTRLTHNREPYEPGYADEVSVSPDGRHVAYAWEELLDTLGNGLIGLRILDLEGGSPRILYQGGDGSKEWADPRGWSPDGRTLSAVIKNAEGEWRVATIDVGSGEVRTVRSLDWRSPGRVEYSPDGRFLAYDRRPSAEDDARDVFVVDLARNGEFEVVASPADDRLLGWLPGSGQLLFQSDRSGTTGVWAQRLENGRATGDPVLVHPEFWKADPQSITADGRLFFSVQTDGFETMVADIDIASNTLRNIEPLLPGSESGRFFSHFRWSWDGSSTGIVTQQGPGRRFVLTVRSEATREVREYPLPVQVGYPGWPFFSRDGNTVAMGARIIGGIPLPSPDGDWNAIVRVDLLTGRIEIDDVLHWGAALLPDGRSALIGRNDPPPDGRVLRPFVRTFSIRDLARHTERVLFAAEQSGGGLFTPDGRSVVTFGSMRPGGPNEPFLTPLDGSSGPRPMSDSPLLLPARAEFRFDPAGGALIAVFDEADRTATGVFPNRTQKALTVERIPLDGSQRTSATVVLPDEFPLINLGRVSGGPTISPQADRILYATGSPAFELWVLEGLPDAATASDR